MAGDVRFVRIHGRIVPIRAKSSVPGTTKPTWKMPAAVEKKFTAFNVGTSAFSGGVIGAAVNHGRVLVRAARIAQRGEKLALHGGWAAFERGSDKLAKVLAKTAWTENTPKIISAFTDTFRKQQALKVGNRMQQAAAIVKKAGPKALLVGAGIGIAAGALWGYAAAKGANHLAGKAKSKKTRELLVGSYWANKKK